MEIKKQDVKLMVFGIVAASYVTIFYDIFQALWMNPLGSDVVVMKVITGIGAMIIGVVIILYLTRYNTLNK